jgi:hypothetical protein
MYGGRQDKRDYEKAKRDAEIERGRIPGVH